MVDLEEFLVLYAKVKKGEVKGLKKIGSILYSMITFPSRRGSWAR